MPEFEGHLQGADGAMGSWVSGEYRPDERETSDGSIVRSYTGKFSVIASPTSRFRDGDAVILDIDAGPKFRAVIRESSIDGARSVTFQSSGLPLRPSPEQTAND